MAVVLASADAQCDGRPRRVSGNVAVDLHGDPDARPGAWGHAGVAEWAIRFSPPAGCAVRIERISGDLVAWPLRRGTGVAGVLAGVMTTGPDGSRFCDLCADNAPIYVQAATSAEPVTRAFSERLRLVLRDARLRLRVAAWLNDTGGPVHVELTYMIAFRWVEAH